MTDKKKQPALPKTGNSLFTGLLFSILLSILYLKLGFTLPAWLQPFGAFKDILTDFAVSAVEDKQDLYEVQRKIALDFGWNREKFVELDTALGHFISEEYYWQRQGQRRIKLLKTIIRKIKEEREKGEYPDLMDSFDRVLRRLPNEARKEHLFIRRYLKKRFPSDTNQEIIAKLETYPIDEIIQRPSISQTVHFQLIMPAKVRVEITDGPYKVVRKLIDAELPAGHYWVHWDRMDDNGLKVSSEGSYLYRVLYDGKRETTGSLKWRTTW